MTTTDIRPMSEEGALQAAGTLSDDQLDDAVRTHLADAIMVGACLTVRRERGTWKTLDHYKTWEEFCQAKYGITRVTAWRKMQQAKAAGELPEGTKPPSQRKVIEARSTPKPNEPEPPSIPEHPTVDGGTAVLLADEVRAATPDEVTAEVVNGLRSQVAALTAEVESLRAGQPPTPIKAATSSKLRDAVLVWLPGLIELPADEVAFTIEDPEVRWATARKLRRWAEQYEMAAKGFTPSAAPRSDLVTPRPKERDKGK